MIKILARCCGAVLFAIAICNSVYAQDWIPYVNNHQQVIQTTVTQQTYTTPQPVITYQYVPCFIQQPLIIEQRCLFHRTQKIVYVPQVQYFYTPILVYR